MQYTEAASSEQVFLLTLVRSWLQRETLQCWGGKMVSPFIPRFLHLELPIFYSLPHHPSTIIPNSVCLFPSKPNSTTALAFWLHIQRNTHIDFITVTKSINQVIFKLVTEPLLPLLPSSPPAHLAYSLTHCSLWKALNVPLLLGAFGWL